MMTVIDTKLEKTGTCVQNLQATFNTYVYTKFPALKNCISLNYFTQFGYYLPITLGLLNGYRDFLLGIISLEQCNIKYVQTISTTVNTTLDCLNTVSF
jgi:hypothetical protein